MKTKTPDAAQEFNESNPLNIDDQMYSVLKVSSQGIYLKEMVLHLWSACSHLHPWLRIRSPSVLLLEPASVSVYVWLLNWDIYH